MGCRAKKPFRGTWCVPGGGREVFDKDELENACRELGEESGIDFSSLDPVFICSWSLRLPFFSWKTFFYSIDSSDMQLKPSEFTELEWVEIGSALKKKLRPFGRSELGCLLRFLK